ncbi:MAG: beta-ketoacyl-[acyl-carrier-protein] synthase family protein, partial [Verrucomicrobiaceae bacterium]
MAYRSGDNSPAVPHRVVVTGAGIVTAHGCGWQANADAVREGRVSLKPVTLFDVTRQRVGIAGQVDLPDTLPPHRLSTRTAGRLERGSHLLLHALHETLKSAGWTGGGKDEKDTLLPVPLCLGTSAGAMTLGEEFHRRTLT